LIYFTSNIYRLVFEADNSSSIIEKKVKISRLGCNMGFLFGCLVLIVSSILVFRNLEIINPFSKGIGISIALSILATGSLGQNYTQSLIPEANDGLGISNAIAYWIIGEDRWSREMFRNAFELSLYLSLIVIYPIVTVIETKLERKPA
jgi:Na+-transporting NADH:ubiquinone oxidoreductase subunit NqrE